MSSLPVQCSVWWSPPIRAPERALRRLDEAERLRYAAYRLAPDRSRFVTGRLLARRALGAELGAEPADIALVTRCPKCGGPHGKPRLAGTAARVDFSIAHAGDRVVVATVGGAAIGVDVEQVRAVDDLLDTDANALAAGELSLVRALPGSARPAAFLRYWTRKEAVLKATGRGLEMPMASLEVTAPSASPEIVSWPASEPSHAARLHDLDAGDGYAACVAVLTTRPLRVAEHVAEGLADS